MTWTKTADDYPDRLIDLSDAAYRLHHAATTYSNRVGTDGYIARSRLTLVPVPSKTRRSRVIDELVSAGLWTERGGGWTIVGFFDAQPSAEEAALTREYHRIRESIRLSKDAEKRAVLEREKNTVMERKNEAVERRKALSRSASGSANGKDPSRYATPRSASKREQGQERTSSADDLGVTASGCEICQEATTDDTREVRYDGQGQPHTFHAQCYRRAA